MSEPCCQGCMQMQRIAFDHNVLLPCFTQGVLGVCLTGKDPQDDSSNSLQRQDLLGGKMTLNSVFNTQRKREDL